MSEVTQFCRICKEDNRPPLCPGFLIGFNYLEKCPYDNNTDLILYNISDDDLLVIGSISKEESFIEAMIKLKQDDIIEYQSRMSQFRTQLGQQESAKKSVEQKEDNKVHCPKCGCSDIQVVPRKWSLLTGFMTNKTDRVCVKCKYKF